MKNVRWNLWILCGTHHIQNTPSEMVSGVVTVCRAALHHGSFETTHDYLSSGAIITSKYYNRVRTIVVLTSNNGP